MVLGINGKSHGLGIKGQVKWVGRTRQLAQVGCAWQDAIIRIDKASRKEQTSCTFQSLSFSSLPRRGSKGRLKGEKKNK